ncbi:DNA-directed RNA polymerase subunit B'' [Candidatus Micrarchaeota archaeon]|nr:DNA-directed RNA polymerase subunit B'' [Candidatus Micrarchaeota archaeon]
MDDGLLKSYFKGNSLVKQHLDSYNKFVEEGLRDIIDGLGQIPTNIEGFELKFGDLRLEKPMIVEADGSRRNILPMEARLRNLTYAAPLFLEIIPVFNGIERRTYSEVFIGELPVMLKSKLCHLDNMTEEELIEAEEDNTDPGGYFIINGSERALVSIEDLAPNRIMVSREKNGELTVSKVFSTREGFRARCAIERRRDGTMKIDFPGAPKNIYLTTILRALGLSKNSDVLKGVVDERVVKNDTLINIEADPTKSIEEAIEYIGKRAAPGQPEEYRNKRVDVLIDNYLLPHLGTTPEDRLTKAYYLIEMSERATKIGEGKIKPDDKDHYSNKRIKLAGTLMEELFRYAFQFLIKDIAYQASRAEARGRRLVVQNLVRPDALSDRIKYAMATGNWIAGQTGVSQLLDRMSYLATASHLRRLISPLNKKHPHFKARDLHGTQWGKLCPNESPEGPSCALVKNIALMCDISTGENSDAIEEILSNMGVKL